MFAVALICRDPQKSSLLSDEERLANERLLAKLAARRARTEEPAQGDTNAQPGVDVKQMGERSCWLCRV